MSVSADLAQESSGGGEHPAPVLGKPAAMDAAPDADNRPTDALPNTVTDSSSAPSPQTGTPRKSENAAVEMVSPSPAELGGPQLDEDDVDWAAPLPPYDKYLLSNFDFMNHSWCCANEPALIDDPNVKPLWTGDSDLRPNTHGIVAGAWCADGDRKYMEDRHRIAYGEASKGAFRAFFGVFDGHGGPETADYAARHMFENMRKCVAVTDSKESVAEQLTRGFLQTEHEVLKHSLKLGSSDGSTACTASVIGNMLYVVNAGDSRCVLSKAGKAFPLSVDHRPDLAMERQRIESNGGQIEQRGVTRPALCCFAKKELKVGSHRLWPGGFSVSRALGNINYKLPCRGRVTSDKILVAEPDVIEHKITPDDQFLILASDGFWDTMTNDDAVQMVLKHQKSLDAKRIAEKMVSRAYRNGSNDNITVVLAFFTHYDPSF